MTEISPLRTSFMQQLRAHKMVAIIRGTDENAIVASCETLVENGVNMIEVALSHPAAIGAITRLAAAGDARLTLGAGTVLSREQARAAFEAGATFMVTPGISEGVRYAVEHQIPVLAGVITPTDIIAALDLGVDAAKVFPIDAMGGRNYLKALRAPFPSAPLIPVGGVTAERFAEYLTDGVLGAGIGSPLVGDAASGGSLDALAQRAREFAAVARNG